MRLVIILGILFFGARFNVIAQVGDSTRRSTDSKTSDTLLILDTAKVVPSNSTKTHSTRVTDTTQIVHEGIDSTITSSHFNDSLHTGIVENDSVRITDSLISIVNIPPAQVADSAYSTPLTNKYGDLLNDDPKYNPKYPWIIPAARVVLTDVVNWAADRYIFKYDWAKISEETWKYNIKKGWEWDNDRFGINFIGHPYSGSYYFNIARANGYNFSQSFPFAVGGSLLWEYFGENTRPSINDIINTPVSGVFLGEIMYRVSSNILDDRTRGGQRVFRELIAAIVDPPRALNRLTQGKMFRVTPAEVYQKEPMNITLNMGIHKINNKVGNNNEFGTGGTNAILHMQIDYGDPFESIQRKPYDVFRGRIELGYGYNKYLISTINGYGLLAGRTIREGRLLTGFFQHYDYWHNNIFEVGTLGFGGGLISKMQTGRHSNIYSNIHLAVVPLAGNNTRYGPDTSEYRFYNFGGGLEGKIEETLNLNSWLNIGFTGFYYWIHTYDGIPGNSLVGILKPTIAVKIFRKVSLGFEHHIYHNDRYLGGVIPQRSTLHLTRTEQKLYLQFFFENSKRSGRYH
ncbi:MAG TPA: DUF3943 domain-containing protein [Flavisolibacter sp.]|jgi:hypothetical protein|nr:DUF3943 domain-containing protein [Flavisolibacter sp.]